MTKGAESIAIKVKMPNDILIVPMDAMLIEQVLINLLLNAATHGGDVSVICITVEDRGREIGFIVSDDGKGIAADLLPVLFDDSGILDIWNEVGDANRFMGIGLSVCRTIVQAHGGSIFAGNLPDGGAEFTFTLPYEKGETDGA